MGHTVVQNFSDREKFRIFFFGWLGGLVPAREVRRRSEAPRPPKSIPRKAPYPRYH